tara:strand:+ start:862 stop:1284 length:423 start_codon:yes stop_codon:yes gene_type:complete
MDKLKADSNNYPIRIAKSSLHLLCWTAAWVATTAFAGLGPGLIWDYATLPTILAILVNLGIGFRLILQIKRYVQALDELGQKIFLNAASITLGVGIVCGPSYTLLASQKLISFQPEIGHLIMLMALTFLAANYAGTRKYR